MSSSSRLNSKRKKKILAMEEDVEEAVSKEEIVDVEEDASTTIMKMKIEEKARQDIVEEIIHGVGMASPKSSVTIVRDMVSTLQNVELQRKCKRKPTMLKIYDKRKIYCC
ncbi:hypothetical protein PanWU01x14_308730 [Parasponia andersonii]|uniref:Uncharacterized protein n=1 Tax=Parasponia andersonii TaxID=3476 RepID=A0A2P5AQY4_PARAD|nr:hypothetical protein PanWU01x14_308730 [Parasponia andersonii]